jgi:sigma-B regulation protein RsbU (phosphoserine phosphatase)
MRDGAEEVQHLRRILDVTRYMAVAGDLDVLLRTIVEATCEVLGCERATIFLYDSAADELYSRAARGVGALRIPADRGIVGVAARQRACVNVPEAQSDPRFNPDVDRATGFHTRNLLTFPLENLQGDLIGVLQALNKTQGAFDAHDEEMARVLSAQAGVALDRGRLIEEYADKQRMQRDLDLARAIQQAQFPKANPRVPGYDLAGWNRCADETGGDCYDFIPLADGRVALLLADATGHGIGAALVISQARSLVRAMLRMSDDLARISAAVNELLAQDLADDRFVTAFLGILEPERHRVRYISSGQGPLLLVRRDSAECRPASALPFAVAAGLSYEPPETFELAAGDTLVLLTDGFYETTNAAQEQFGVERVVSLVQGALDDPVPRMIERLHEAVQRFGNGQPQADDLTAILVRRVA